MSCSVNMFRICLYESHFRKNHVLPLFQKFCFCVLISETLAVASLIIATKLNQKNSRFRRIDPREFWILFSEVSLVEKRQEFAKYVAAEATLEFL